MEKSKIIDRLAFCGEQVLSFMDEITKTQCPNCNRTDLSLTLVGKALIVRCSEMLNEYNDEEGVINQDDVCDFTKIIKLVNIHDGPFVLKFDSTKRATPQNRSAAPKRGRPRKRTT